MFGFINLKKPRDWTSHDCVAKVRRLLKVRKVGHGGTLDPLATGVLPIAVGRVTRLLGYLPTRKAYRATVRFGIQTTTDDLEGEVIRTENASDLTLAEVEPHLSQFLGIITQIPPQYSAIQRDGKRLYELARQGLVVEVPSRQVEIIKIEVLGWRSQTFPELDLHITCGEGTYIRAIARDLGDLLEVGGTLAALERTESGGMQLADSMTLEALTEQVQQGTINFQSPEKLLAHLPTINLEPEPAKRWCQGQKILLPDSSRCPAMENVNVQDGDRQYLGVGKVLDLGEGFYLSPQVVLTPFCPSPSTEEIIV